MITVARSLKNTIAKTQAQGRRLLALGLLSLACCQAAAIELGPMSIYSKIGQSFSADIQIGGLDGIATETVQLRVLPESAYAQLGIAYDPILNDVILNLSKLNDDSGIIEVRTVLPYANGSINLLLEINYPDGSRVGQKIIEYAGILDPTFLENITEPPPALAVRAPLDTPTRLEQQLLSTHIETARGDTWENISSTIKQAYMRNDAITTEQIMMALRQRNPELFASGSNAEVETNIAVQMPSYAQIADLNPQQAATQVASINNAYLQSLARAQRVRPNAPRLTPNSTTQLTSSAEVKRQAAAAPAAAQSAPLSEEDIALERIELVTQLADSDLRDQIAGVYEEIDKRNLEGSDLRAQIALLDQQAADLQQLVRFKSQQLKLLQQSLQQQLLDEQRRQALPKFQTETFMDVVQAKVLERPVFWLMLAIGVLLLSMMVGFVIFSLRAYGTNVRRAHRDQIILDERMAKEKRMSEEDAEGPKRRGGKRATDARGRGAGEQSDSSLSAIDDRGPIFRRGMGEMVAGVSRRSRINPPQTEPYKLQLPDILQLSAERNERSIEDRQNAARQMNRNSQGYLTPGNNIVKVNLDLALAYINMRQYNEARTLLNQVLKDGSSEEVQRAQLLLNGMARRETQAA